MSRKPALLVFLPVLALATMGAGPVVPKVEVHPIDLALIHPPEVQLGELARRLEAVRGSNAVGTISATVNGEPLTVAPASGDDDGRLVLDVEPVQLRIFAEDPSSRTTLVLVLDGLGQQWKFHSAMVVERDGTTYTTTTGSVQVAEVAEDSYQGSFSFTASHGASTVEVQGGHFALGLNR